MNLAAWSDLIWYLNIAATTVLLGQFVLQRLYRSYPLLFGYFLVDLAQDAVALNRRTVADVSAIADPATGVAVYDSYGSSGGANWYVFGGTSVAAPIVAGVYALAGNVSSISYGSYAYSHTASLFDATSGSNGSCGGSYLCTAKVGYDGPTGLGTPNGLGAF